MAKQPSITLWSLQPVALWETLQREKVPCVGPTHDRFIPMASVDNGQPCRQYLKSYDYMRRQCLSWQATFEKLRLDQVTQVTSFVGRRRR